MFGRVFWFAAGAWTGILAKQVYDIPELPFPGEALEKAKALLEEMKSDNPDGDATKELRGAMDKLKELEQKYRKGGD